MTGRAVYWLLSAATLAVYGIMVVWSLPVIQDSAGGLRPFDLRPMGYTVAEARNLVDALGSEGRAFYAGPQHRLDTVFPALLAAWSIWTLLALLPRRAAWALAVVALAGAAADYAENARVAALLVAFDDATAIAASRMTVLKSACATLIYSVILVALLRLGWQRLRS